MAALVKAIVLGTPEETRNRLDIVRPAMSPVMGRAARAITSWPLRRLVKLVGGRSYAHRLAARKARALAYCEASPTLRPYLPTAHGREQP